MLYPVAKLEEALLSVNVFLANGNYSSHTKVTIYFTCASAERICGVLFIDWAYAFWENADFVFGL